MSNNFNQQNPSSLANRITALEVKVERLEKNQESMHKENSARLDGVLKEIKENRNSHDEKYSKTQRTLGIGIGIIITVNAAIAVAIALFHK